MLREFKLKTYESEILYKRAMKVLPAGVSYSIRYYNPYPFYTSKAIGSKLFDVDGNEYIDFWLGHTALILGHSPQIVMKSVQEQLELGTHFGTSHKLEIMLAGKVVELVPCSEMVRFTNSGTEANMYAIRLARTYTGRNTIAKFEGGWHGGYDALHTGVKFPYDIPESAGLTSGALEDTILLPFNDLEGVKKKLRDKKVAAIVIEPVLGAGGSIPADKQFLKGLRELCNKRSILLIFDEVITGFRLAPGGGQQYFGVIPDITVLGKVLGGGFPIGAFCANKEIMERINILEYERPHYSFHGGTFSANPISMIAGLETLKLLEDGQLIKGLNQAGENIRTRLKEIFETNNISAQITGTGSLFNIHFSQQKIKDARGVSKADRKKQIEYHTSLITDGVFFLPSHTGALSQAHDQVDFEKLYSATINFIHKKK